MYEWMNLQTFKTINGKKLEAIKYWSTILVSNFSSRAILTSRGEEKEIEREGWERGKLRLKFPRWLLHNS